MSAADEVHYLELRALLRWAVDELPSEHLLAAVTWMGEHVREPLWYNRAHIEVNERLQHIQRLKKALGMDYEDGPWMKG